ncbi:manganese-superoxide dismutase precursor [Calocera viscosa TUFC12733]|uniref:Superoxide dismutase n=1 Tax=Calocera viscosa (strain TUFC12733) TaxID=1330018 RepID=A0A167GXT5_CALVF|nr:manganese-superoxide dismutase precursor [Calocera viscosa TUFC12733]
MAKYTLPDLPYAYDALQPYISKEIMTLHHKNHHQTYVTNLNAAEANLASLAGDDIKEKLKLQAALRFNGGGHINHSLFWKNLAPAQSPAARLAAGPLKDAINRDFGSLEAMIKEVNGATAALQGSGWGWLGLNTKSKKLEVVTTPNQDPLLSHAVIIGIDIWEHAYYLDYKNVKVNYLDAIWHVMNFQEAEARYKAAL